MKDKIISNLIVIAILAIWSFSSGVIGYEIGFNKGYDSSTVEGAVKIETITKEISIIKEEKDCKEKGGEFSISGIDNRYVSYPDDYGYKLTCTKPPETLSEIIIN